MKKLEEVLAQNTRDDIEKLKYTAGACGLKIAAVTVETTENGNPRIKTATLVDNDYSDVCRLHHGFYSDD